MRMKLITGLVMAVAFGAAAHATEFVSNGGFETASAGSFEYDTSQHTGTVASWTYSDPVGNHSYNILFKTATATSVQPTTRFPGQNQDLWALPSNTNVASTPGANIGNNFMALDGANGSPNNVQGELQQQITGLTAGQTYTLTFDFAAGQLKDRVGATSDYLVVSLGSQSFTTDTLNDASGSATPWKLETFTFTATGTSELLKFLAYGTPNGDPPMALIDNVSLTNTVPEPATWGLMLVGVAAIGASLRMRRRAIATLA